MQQGLSIYCVLLISSLGKGIAGACVAILACFCLLKLLKVEGYDVCGEGGDARVEVVARNGRHLCEVRCPTGKMLLKELFRPLLSFAPSSTSCCIGVKSPSPHPFTPTMTAAGSCAYLDISLDSPHVVSPHSSSGPHEREHTF